MFSVDRLTRSLRPCPPTPTAATFRRSLGAVKPFPRTLRGTIAYPAPVIATFLTRPRREVLMTISPRHLVKNVAITGAGFAIVPRSVLGKGFSAQSDTTKRADASGD